jgi:sec-independent protein translocase protein TatB
MFDIGFSELLVIAIVALLVLGPERLPRAARFAGLWVRRARAQWYSVKSELESELADDELKRSLQRTRDELRDVQDQLQAQGRGLQQQFERERQQIEHDVMQAHGGPEHAASDSTGPEPVPSQPAVNADTGFSGAIDDPEHSDPRSGDSGDRRQAAVTSDPSQPDAGPAEPAKRPPPSWSRP